MSEEKPEVKESKVVSIFRKKAKDEKETEKSAAEPEEVYDFEKLFQENLKKKEALAKERLKHNRGVKKSYNLTDK